MQTMSAPLVPARKVTCIHAYHAYTVHVNSVCQRMQVPVNCQANGAAWHGSEVSQTGTTGTIKFEVLSDMKDPITSSSFKTERTLALVQSTLVWGLQPCESISVCEPSTHPEDHNKAGLRYKLVDARGGHRGQHILWARIHEHVGLP